MLGSFHGGHSGEFCEHAHGTLEEIIEAAISKGASHYGISEHAPRYYPKHLYENEIKKGYTIQKLSENFEKYSLKFDQLRKKYQEKIHLLKGFEVEALPHDDYDMRMKDLKIRYNFDYYVGSVHFMNDIPLDMDETNFKKILAIYHGNVENLVMAYYELVHQMILKLEPEVVAHLDLIRKYAKKFGDCYTRKIMKKVEDVLYTVKKLDLVLDLNFSTFRRKLGEPYPAGDIVELAKKFKIPFCFGDDSHGPDQVFDGLELAKKYLLKYDIKSVVIFEKNGKKLLKKEAPI